MTPSFRHNELLFLTSFESLRPVLQLRRLIPILFSIPRRKFYFSLWTDVRELCKRVNSSYHARTAGSVAKIVSVSLLEYSVIFTPLTIASLLLLLIFFAQTTGTGTDWLFPHSPEYISLSVYRSQWKGHIFHGLSLIKSVVVCGVFFPVQRLWDVGPIQRLVYFKSQLQWVRHPKS